VAQQAWLIDTPKATEYSVTWVIIAELRTPPD
jgi:hypothetical protein